MVAWRYCWTPKPMKSRKIAAAARAPRKVLRAALLSPKGMSIPRRFLGTLPFSTSISSFKTSLRVA